MGEPAIDPVETSADLHLRQATCVRNCALQCLMHATDTDIRTIGETYDQRVLLGISYSTWPYWNVPQKRASMSQIGYTW